VLAGTNTPVTNEPYGTGDGTMGPFTHTLVELPIVPGTVSIDAQGTPITNETYGTGNGTSGPYTHTAASFPIVPGSIVIHNNTTGLQYVTDNGSGVLINAAGVNVGTVNYSTGAMSVTFQNVVGPGNVLKVAYTPEQTVTDDGNGNLVGEGTGTINYQTGAASVTFTNNVPNSLPITVNYTPFGKPPPTCSIVTVTDYSVILVQANSQILISNL